jgi:ribonuclease P protein subunit RPR2
MVALGGDPHHRDVAVSAPASTTGTRMGAFSLDREGVVVGWTRGAQDLLGWTTQETLGRLPPVPAPRWWSWPTIERELVDEPVVWTTAAGRATELAISTTADVDPDAQVVGTTVVLRDISIRDRSREQLEAFARDVRASYGRDLRRLAELERSYVATVTALATAVEAKDGSTGEHIRRVHDLGLLLTAEVLPEQVDDPQLSYGFLLHDVGKLSVPDAVLNKPGPLDDREWALMRRHPEEGVRILRPVGFLDSALDVVRFHHERWDGTGYPEGRSGDSIPLSARIFAIADTVDAMTSDRPYRAGLPLEAARQELLAHAGTQFDPACVEAFVALDPEHLAGLLQPRGDD